LFFYFEIFYSSDLNPILSKTDPWQDLAEGLPNNETCCILPSISVIAMLTDAKDRATHPSKFKEIKNVQNG
jgi:hypothetical protein